MTARHKLRLANAEIKMLEKKLARPVQDETRETWEHQLRHWEKVRAEAIERIDAGFLGELP
jgi:hypothetical protein